jgi:uncharacterized protein (UPF0147 family)
LSGENVEDLIKKINNEMDLLINDMSVPKNVRSSITEAKEKLNSNDEYSVRISAATYNIDSVSNDVNLQQQARTRLWNILSLLESIKN